MHRRQPSPQCIWLTVTILLSGLLWTSTASASPTASVSLVYFRAEYGSDGAHLQWQTATELNTAGFRIQRSSAANGPYEAHSQIGVVPAQGSATNGSTYDEVDETAAQGQTYWYRLIEIENDNDEHELETVSLFVGATPTATIEAIATTATDATEQSPIDSATSTATMTPTMSTTAPPTTASIRPTATQLSPTLSPAPSGSPTPFADEAITGATPTVGDNAAQAAGEPTAVAQVTASYPGPEPTEGALNDGYPGSDAPAATATLAPETDQPDTAYPPGFTNPALTPSFENNQDNVVGSRATGVDAEGEVQQSSALGRVLLWLGFVIALIIFIAGVFFSIVLSTRKQRRPDEPSGL